ncbi:hypothetical protein [Bacillus solimangrovi]|uniref:Cytochrome-c oxidase n=1 Tax=Bacillus solimangrovi TaxID=1305675 RepID=A0A1E5LG00_9BACI|nr:hypothetical protein [Bacillus solimangrovi]OEH93001.1 hypothetical protein BFG57_14155 [Bacillus solimangrovi]
MNRTRMLIQASALAALVGTFMGSHMAGSLNYAMRPMHAHILVVGWLSLFAFGAFYKLFPIPATSKLANAQAITGIIGAFVLPIGMYIDLLKDTAITTTLYIGGGVFLLISFILFALITFIYRKEL